MQSNFDDDELEIIASDDEILTNPLYKRRPSKPLLMETATKRQCLDNRENSTNISNGNDELSTEALIVRGKFPSIVVQTNKYEDDWTCDVCCSKLDEEDDPLAICDLCNVVVHACCYRKDLYEQDIDDESPWYC